MTAPWGRGVAPAPPPETAWPTVMVTGHRPQHLRPEARPWVKSELERLALKLRDKYGMTTGISGMAIGADLWWADAVVRAGVRLEAHVPFPQQPDKWQPADQADWHRLVGQAAKVVTYGTGYDVRLLHARNRGMVDASSGVVSVWVPGREGGTMAALRYAIQRGRRPIWVDPDALRTVWPTLDTWRSLLPPPRHSRKAAA